MSAAAAARMTDVLFLSVIVSVDCEVCRRRGARVRRLPPRTRSEGQFCNNLRTPDSQALQINSAQRRSRLVEFGPLNTAIRRHSPRKTATAKYRTFPQLV